MYNLCGNWEKPPLFCLKKTQKPKKEEEEEEEIMPVQLFLLFNLLISFQKLF